MKRQEFIKSAGLGLGLALLPMVSKSENSAAIKEINNMGSERSGKKEKIVRNQDGNRVNVIGDRQNHKLTGEDTNGQFTLIEELNPPGVKIPLHVHKNEDEVFHVLEGELKVTVGDKTTVLKAGDLGFLPRNIPHSWETTGETNTRVLLSVFPAGLEKMFEELGSLPEGPPDFEKVKSIVGRYDIEFL